MDNQSLPTNDKQTQPTKDDRFTWEDGDIQILNGEPLSAKNTNVDEFKKNLDSDKE